MSMPIPSRRTCTLGAIAALCVALAVYVPGCTVIGLVIGGATDARRGSGGTELLLNVKVGHRIRLRTWDDHTLEGRFAGWSRDSGYALASHEIGTLRGVTIRLATRDSVLAVPAETIAHVDVPLVPTGALTGMLVGLTVDVLVVRSVQDIDPFSGGCEGGSDYHPFGARTQPTHATPQH